tara:strand:- start:4474 stop:5040 length:567 start_codon:yes stop_codon:yes gene_type:complete
MQVAKDEMDFMKDIDKLGFTTEVKLLGLTKKQQKELAAMDVNIRKAFLEELKSGTAWKLAEAKLLKAKGIGSENMIKIARLDKSVRDSFMKRAAAAFGYRLDDAGDYAGGKDIKLWKEEADKVTKLYLEMAEAYANSPNRVLGQRRADAILAKHAKANIPSLENIGTDNPNVDKRRPANPPGTVPISE